MSKPELSDIAIELACIGIDALIFGFIYKINKTHKNNIEAIKVSNIRFHEIFDTFYSRFCPVYFRKLPQLTCTKLQIFVILLKPKEHLMSKTLVRFPYPM